MPNPRRRSNMLLPTAVIGVIAVGLLIFACARGEGEHLRGLSAAAGLGTMVAFVTAWSLWAVTRLPLEIGIMGLRFTLIRLGVTFFFPPIAGLMAQVFFKR
ncbi:MAG: hypothetical protein JW775_11710 [Candidatus Aminicenantes bacterium]|nr:hypothetical protein [Candidatus Aminicenantes bacterium]